LSKETLSSDKANLSFYTTLSDADSKNTSLSSMVSYHDSPMNKSVSSIHTRSQLEKILSDENCDSVVDTSSTPFFSYNYEEYSYKPGIPYHASEKDNSLNKIQFFIEKDSVTERKSISDDGFQPIYLRQYPTAEVVPVIETGINKILKHYGILPAELNALELKLRIWICNTIIRPLVCKVEELNSLFSEKFSGLHIRVGTSTTETLKNVLSHKPELCTTVLPFVLPYLQLHQNQSYLIRRIRELSENIALEEFRWNSGGIDPARDEKNEFTRYMSWNEQFPTDSEILWGLFCIYMDFHLSPSSGTSSSTELIRPFSSVYFLKAQTTNFPLNENPEAFFIKMTSEHPPTFELAINGGKTIILPCKDTQHNFWLVLILFLKHIQKHNHSRISHLHLSSISLDIFDI